MKEENISLEKCMSTFFQIENMTGANKYDCCRCPTHKQDGTKQMSIDSTGEMLCLHLKRFDGVGKKNRIVTFPLNNFNLKPYMTQLNEYQR